MRLTKNYPASKSHPRGLKAPAAPRVPHFPRLRALALFGRRPPQLVDSLVMPASENLHNNGSSQHPPRLGIPRTVPTIFEIGSKIWLATISKVAKELDRLLCSIPWHPTSHHDLDLRQ